VEEISAEVGFNYDYGVAASAAECSEERHRVAFGREHWVEKWIAAQ